MGERERGGPIKVLLADDHTMFREGLASLLARYEDVEVVGDTSNDEEAAGLARERRPDVMIMQVQMPFERAKRRLSEMLEVSPRPKVVIVTMFRNPRYVRELMGLGASAYMLKSTSVEHLLAVIRGAVLHPDEENAVVNMPREAVEAERGGSGGVLTGREMEVLLLAARGLENSRIASRLRIAEGSVRRHLMNIYRKLGVNSRTEAIREALSEDWITIEDFTQEAEEEGNS